MVICRHCKEQLLEGDYTRAEPASPGSTKYLFYHDSCWRQVKEIRQRDPRQQELAFPDYPDRS